SEGPPNTLKRDARPVLPIAASPVLSVLAPGRSYVSLRNATCVYAPSPPPPVKPMAPGLKYKAVGFVAMTPPCSPPMRCDENPDACASRDPPTSASPKAAPTTPHLKVFILPGPAIQGCPFHVKTSRAPTRVFIARELGMEL